MYLKLAIYSTVTMLRLYKECIVAEKQVVFHCTVDERTIKLILN